MTAQRFIPVQDSHSSGHPPGIRLDNEVATLPATARIPFLDPSDADARDGQGGSVPASAFQLAAPVPATVKRVMNEIQSRDGLDTAIAADPSLATWIQQNVDVLEFRRYREPGLDVKMTFDVVTSDPNANPTTTGDPTSRLIAPGLWIGQRFDQEVWAEQLGARRDGVTSDTIAIRNLMRLSEHRKFIARFGQGTYRVDGNDVATDEAIRLDTGTWFEGAAMVCAGRRRTIFDFIPKDDYQVLFEFNGGSGQDNNKYARGFTARLSSGHTGKGILIRLADSCYVNLKNVALVGAAVNLEVANTNASGGSGFCEFNIYENLFLDGATYAAVHMHRRSGTDSLNGNKFRDCFMRINDGPGIRIGGNSWAATPVSGGGLFLYNAELHFDVMSDSSGTKTALISENTNTEGVFGRFKVENRAGANTEFRCESGIFNFNGAINAISNVTFGGAARANMDFSGGVIASKTTRSVKGAFASATLPSMNVGPAGNLFDHGKANGGGAALMEILGTNVNAVGVMTFDPAASGLNGLWVGYTQLADSGVTAYKPGWLFRSDGALIEGGTGTITIRQRGQTSGITIANGRFGGALGRPVPSALRANNGIPANAGVPQVVTIWTNAWNESASIALVIIRGTNVDYRYILAFAHDGFGGNGYVNTIATLRSLNSTGGAVTAPTFSVNSDGDLRVTITTDRDLTVRGSEMSFNGVLTS